MRTVETRAVVDAAGLAELLTARTEPVLERDEGDGVFELEDGPFSAYRRVVERTDRADGDYDVVQTTTYELAIPVWGALFQPLVRKAIRNPPKPGQRLWWLPPDRMDRRATEVLALLCAFSMMAGFLGVIIGQLNPYFKREFALSNDEVANVLIGVRAAGVIALVVVAFADRRGRRRVLLSATYAAIGFAAIGALAPGVGWLVVSQTLARTFSAAMGILVGIMSAEEMPRGARAFAVSMLVASGALGAGGVVVFLQIAELAPWAWRIFLVVPLLALIPAIRLGRRLPESRRFEVFELNELADARPTDGTVTATAGPASPEGATPLRDRHGFRFLVLGTTAFLVNVFAAPAGQFLNEYLKGEHGYSGGTISALQVFTNLPGGLSMIVGGRLAESRGRRLIGAIGTFAGIGFTVLMFLSSGGWIWAFSTLGTLIGAIAVPALGVYSAELFPTGQRGLAGGGLNLVGVFGAVLGLKAAGILSGPDHFGSFGPTMAVLGVGALIVPILIIAFYPETMHQELEALNPEDAPPPVGHEALEQLDEVWEEVHEEHPADHRHRLGDHHRHHDDPPTGGTGTLPPRA